MKRSALLLICFVMALCGCHKEFAEEMPSVDTHYVTFNANALGTKTTMSYDDQTGSYSMLWEVGDQITVFEYADGYDYPVKYLSEPLTESDISNNGKSAQFRVDINNPESKISIDKSNASNFKYVAVYPGTFSGGYEPGCEYLNWDGKEESDPQYDSWCENWGYNGPSVDPHLLLRVVLPYEQSPTANSFDPTANTMVSKVIESNSQIQDMADLQFARIGGIIRITVKGLNDYVGQQITSARFSFGGRAHLKHTEGGDFRQAAWRALRHGLMRAAERGDALLLEPMESIELELPRLCVGRAMTDLQNMGAKFELQESDGDAERVLLVGRAPASALRGYAKEVTAYTRGEGKLSSVYDGYAPCHNTDDVLRLLRYEPTRDLDHPSDSIFCAHGAGFAVPWHEVEQHMHLPPYYVRRDEVDADEPARAARVAKRSAFTEDKELEALMEREFGPIRRKSYGEKRVVAAVTHQPTVVNAKLRRLVLDGYNVIFGWDALREVGEASIEAARSLLIDALCNYAGYIDIPVDIVFDAYRVKGGVGEEEQKGKVHIVYTKENETADAYIERLLTRESRDYSIRVVTSDRLIQVTAVSTGVLRMHTKLRLKHNGTST